ncbi:hypothetical protein D9M71_690050 [compost metagenome]
MQQLGLAQQHRAAARLVHRLGRAAEVEVDHRRAQTGGEGGVVGQAHRIGAEQLQTHRRAAGGAPAAVQLRRQLAKARARQQAVADADELADAPVDAADLGQQLAEDFIDQPLHGRQGNLHRGSSRSKTGPRILKGCAAPGEPQTRLVVGNADHFAAGATSARP